MLQSDICEQTAVHAIERVFYGEWKHEGCILGCSSQYINFEIDGKEYVFVLHEVENGHNFVEYLK